MLSTRVSRRKRNNLQAISRLIQLSVASTKPLWIPYGDNQGLLIDGRNGTFHEIGQVMDELCQQGANLASLAWLEGELPASTRHLARSLNELQWAAAFYEYEGELPEYLRRDDIIGLKDWTTFIPAPCPPEFEKVVTLFRKRATSPAFAARLLKLDEDILHHFYFAAWHANQTIHVNRQAHHQQVRDEFENPQRSFRKALLGILTTDVKDLVGVRALVRIHQNVRNVLTMDVMDFMRTDVMVILKADLLSPFKQAAAEKPAVPLKTQHIADNAVLNNPFWSQFDPQTVPSAEQSAVTRANTFAANDRGTRSASIITLRRGQVSR